MRRLFDDRSVGAESKIILVFGILILIMPKLLNYLIAIYLIFVGIVGLWPHFLSTPAT